jgi:hypothetical protein
MKGRSSPICTAPHNERSALATEAEPKAVRRPGTERKQFRELNAYSREYDAWVLSSPNDPWC